MMLDVRLTVYHCRFTLSNAHFEQFGKQYQDPCDVRTYCCNPETTITTPFTNVATVEKNFRPGCGPCCQQSHVQVSLNTHVTSGNDTMARTHTNIHTFPAEVDKVYSAIKDTWEKQKMIMAGVIRNM